MAFIEMDFASGGSKSSFEQQKGTIQSSSLSLNFEKKVKILLLMIWNPSTSPTKSLCNYANIEDGVLYENYTNHPTWSDFAEGSLTHTFTITNDGKTFTRNIDTGAYNNANYIAVAVF